MFAKIASLMLAAAALAGAVVYAQSQAEKGKKPKPVFDTSKSGTPTPIEEAPPAAGVTPPIPAQTNQPEQADKKPGKKKKGDITIMPSSKSMTPPPPKPPKPPEPTPPVPPT